MALDFASILEMFPGPTPPATKFNAEEMNARWKNLDDRINVLELNNLLTFFIPGVLTVSNTVRFRWPFGSQNVSMGLAVLTAPTVTNLIFQLEVNSVDVFKAGERPIIAAGDMYGNYSVDGTNLGALAENETAIFQVDQIGSGVAGANLAVIMRTEKTLA